MHSSIIILSATYGLATASNPFPWTYGVPKWPEMPMDEVMTDLEIAMAAQENDIDLFSRDTVSKRQRGGEPCAALGRAIDAMPAGSRKVVPAEMGMKCLESVPLDVEGNAQLIDDIKLYAKWQSNLAYIKNPPADYTEKAVDIMGELDNMKSQLTGDTFKSEYNFQIKMASLIESGFDNHFVWQPDIASVIQFQRAPGMELVALSADGTAVPEIYSYRDVLRARNDTAFKPSAVTKINGISTKEYLTNLTTSGDFHEAHTRWNALFPSQPLIASGTTFLGSFRSGAYQGPDTTMEFANGTNYSMLNLAVVLRNFTGVTSGQTFFEKFCNGPQPVTPAPAPPQTPPGNQTQITPVPPPAPSHIGYPKAELINADLAVGGYYLDGANYQDVAVLSIPSYLSEDVQTFQNTMRDFIRQSSASGKTKMIFDLRGNGGGNAILGYDSFKQVFPQASAEPFGGTRMRANDALNTAGQITQDFTTRSTYAQQNRSAFLEAFGQGTTEQDIFLITSIFNYQHTLSAENTALADWPAFFGPETFNNDSFTNLGRYNYSDPISTTYGGFSVIGYNENANETSTPQPFEPANMVMLLDGMCSSTCAIAAELLKNQGGVRSIAIGGLPQSGPMQGVAGTKGAQVFSWDDIQLRLQAAYFLGSPEQRAQWDEQDLGKTAFARQIFRRSAYTGAGQTAGGVNLKDNLRQGDASGVPLEFITEQADCRMFFTAGMVADVTQVWKGVADRMFGSDMQGCVEGSTGDQTSVSGGGRFRGGDGTVTAARTGDVGGGSEGEGEGAGVAEASTASGRGVVVGSCCWCAVCVCDGVETRRL